jgi:hypothetical protein
LFSPKPTGWNDVRTAGIPARTAVRIMGLLGRTSATANSKGDRIIISEAARSLSE